MTEGPTTPAPRERRSATSRAATEMGVITAASRALGFLRVLVVAAVLGTTYLGNAFQAANSVSNVLFELLAAGALSAVLVPALVDRFQDDDTAGAEQVAGGLLGAGLAVLGAVTVLGVVGAPLLARVLTAGVPAGVAADQRELVTFLLWFFVPQVLLYAAGTVAIAVLHARRRFTATVAAPIGNTVVMIACLAAFRAVAGSDPGLDLDATERFLLVAAGTGGVLAFVGWLLVACAASGFRLRPRRFRGDERVAAVLRHAGWGVAVQAAAGILLGAAVVAGSAVEGGVVAYQVGWVFFLAPYAVLAQPIQTALFPELVVEVRGSDTPAFSASVRWALERTARLAVPVAAGMIAFALPAMRAVAFGETGPEGARLIAAAVASLAVGLYPYGVFLLLARAFYALGDSRTPGVVALVTSLLGAVGIAVGAPLTEGAGRVAVLGFGHTAAYAAGAAVLGVLLGRRTAAAVRPAALGRMLVVAAAGGLVGWAVQRAVVPSDPGRLAEIAALAVAAAAGTAVVIAGDRALRIGAAMTDRVAVP